jgi:hypothetical protein
MWRNRNVVYLEAPSDRDDYDSFGADGDEDQAVIGRINQIVTQFAGQKPK